VRYIHVGGSSSKSASICICITCTPTAGRHAHVSGWHSWDPLVMVADFTSSATAPYSTLSDEILTTAAQLYVYKNMFKNMQQVNDLGGHSNSFELPLNCH